MSRLVLAIALGVAGVSACGGTSASGPAVVAGAPAGKVTAVQGAVTAVRGDARRPLAAGDAVSGDDDIETGADGRVTITLDHNQVPFSLGPERQQQVGKSPAWSAPRGTAVAVTSNDRSGAAGRHAEREAADTLASAPGAAAAPAPPAMAAPAAPEAMAPPAAAVAMNDPAPSGGKAGARRSADRELELPKPPPPPPDVTADEVAKAMLTTKGASGGGAPDDVFSADVDIDGDSDAESAKALSLESSGRKRKIVAQAGRGEPIKLVDPDDPLAGRSGGGGGGGSGSGSGGGSGSGSGSATPRLVAMVESVETGGGLAAAVVLKTVRSRALSLRECAGAAPAVTTFALTLTVAPSGAVAASKATGGSVDVDSCLSKQLGALTFPAAGAATTARLTLKLVPR